MSVTIDKVKGKFLYSSISNTEDCSVHCTVYSLTDLFNGTPSWLLWKAFSHAAVNTHTVHKHTFTRY